MATDTKPTKGGKLGTLNVPITVGIIAGLLAIGLTVLYAMADKQRPVIAFAVVALAAAAGVTSAYYVGEGLRETARSGMLTRTFSYHHRWGDPAFQPARDAMKGVVDQFHRDINRGDKIRKAIAEEPGLERSIIATMNFLEELALAINEQAIDEELSRRFFQGAVLVYFETLLPWVQELRDTRGRALIFVELESLYNSWKKQ